MLELPDSWLWDFWLADDGDRFHVFFLFASRGLVQQERRHRRASIGHAVSTDLVTWERMPDALVRSDAPAFDDLATWTGSTIRDHDGRWRLFYTGVSDDPVPVVQRVSSAVSDDLITWRKVGHPLAVADPAHYATAGNSGDEPWRDPWVFGYEGEWHMLTTARSNATDEFFEAGAIGHAVSPDLDVWTVLPPVTGVGHGFSQLEVPQTLEFEGRWYLLFACLTDELAPRRRTDAGGGTYLADAASPIGPFDLDGAELITDASRYAGRAIRDRAGVWQLLTFRNREQGRFVGALADPVPLEPLIRRFRSARPGR